MVRKVWGKEPATARPCTALPRPNHPPAHPHASHPRATSCSQSLVVQPFTATGEPVLADGATITFNLTATNTGACFGRQTGRRRQGAPVCYGPNSPAATNQHSLVPPHSFRTAAINKVAKSSISVAIARRPSCTAAACLAVSPSSGAADSTAFAASASGFAADSALVYDFGVQLPSGRRDTHARGASDPRFTFAPRTLPAGPHTLFVCARGASARERGG